MIKLRTNPYRTLEKSIGYRFRKRKLLDEALMHRSYRFERSDVDRDNQRLEFLGDAILGFVTAAYLYKRFKQREEGIMTSIRTQITSGRALGRIAS